MFRDNALKRRLAEGKRALGCWLFSGSATAAEVIGLAGYDFILIDQEHGPGDPLAAVSQLQSACRHHRRRSCCVWPGTTRS